MVTKARDIRIFGSAEFGLKNLFATTSKTIFVLVESQCTHSSSTSQLTYHNLLSSMNVGQRPGWSWDTSSRHNWSLSILNWSTMLGEKVRSVTVKESIFLQSDLSLTTLNSILLFLSKRRLVSWVARLQTCRLLCLRTFSWQVKWHTWWSTSITLNAQTLAHW